MISDLWFRLAWLVPRRLAYWCAVRVIDHASGVLLSVEVDAMRPSQILQAWDVPIEEGDDTR